MLGFKHIAAHIRYRFESIFYAVFTLRVRCLCFVYGFAVFGGFIRIFEFNVTFRIVQVYSGFAPFIVVLVTHHVFAATQFGNLAAGVRRLRAVLLAFLGAVRDCRHVVFAVVPVSEFASVGKSFGAHYTRAVHIFERGFILARFVYFGGYFAVFGVLAFGIEFARAIQAVILKRLYHIPVFVVYRFFYSFTCYMFFTLNITFGINYTTKQIIP